MLVSASRLAMPAVSRSSTRPCSCTAVAPPRLTRSPTAFWARLRGVSVSPSAISRYARHASGIFRSSRARVGCHATGRFAWELRYRALRSAVSRGKGCRMATVDECRTALHGLAAKLEEHAETQGKLDFERTLACRVPDLGAAFHGRLSGGRLLDIADGDDPTAKIALTAQS